MAAVFANNFSNHMYYIAKKICDQNDIEFEIVLPLINGAMQKLKNKEPEMIQTGPARRMDLQTISKHKDLLKDEEFKLLYSEITKSILGTYHEDYKRDVN